MSVKQEAVARAVKLLGAAGARFKIICDDGAEYGELTVCADETRPKRRAKHFSSYYKPYLDKLEPGGIVSIPYAPFRDEVSVLSSSISAWGIIAWGKGNCITARNDAEGTIEVMRVE